MLGGPRIFIKRDDLTGLAEGGNKTRKLEYLMAEAIAQGADTVVTLGAAQSNHCRQTAAAAARCGLRCILVLRGDPPAGSTGNLLLDRLLGAELAWSGSRPREQVMDEVVAYEQASGRRPYAIPLGGSSALGAAAYAVAMDELADQMAKLGQPAARFDRIILASSSGGTHAGLVAGGFLTGFDGQISGSASTRNSPGSRRPSRASRPIRPACSDARAASCPAIFRRILITSVRDTVSWVSRSARLFPCLHARKVSCWIRFIPDERPRA